MLNDLHPSNFDTMYDDVITCKSQLKVILENNLLNKNYFLFARRSLFYITGGAFASLLQNNSPNDIDIYCKDPQEIERLKSEILYHHQDDIANVPEDYKPSSSGTSFTILKNKMVSDWAITMKSGISFITKTTGDPQTIHKTFDYIHCMPHYELFSGRLWISALKYYACKHKLLIYNPNYHFETKQNKREDKFIKQGYKLCNMTLNNS